MSFDIKSSSYFAKNLKQLAKKYKKIKQDYADLLRLLQKNPTSGTPLGNDIYKIRLQNSSIPTGKRGGFRAITLVKIEKETIVLLAIYSKREKEDISSEEMTEILGDIEE